MWNASLNQVENTSSSREHFDNDVLQSDPFSGCLTSCQTMRTLKRSSLATSWHSRSWKCMTALQGCGGRLVLIPYHESWLPQAEAASRAGRISGCHRVANYQDSRFKLQVSDKHISGGDAFSALAVTTWDTAPADSRCTARSAVCESSEALRMTQ